ncbi:type II secretion system minor pseudopilin GspJ [Eionea flava]
MRSTMPALTPPLIPPQASSSLVLARGFTLIEMLVALGIGAVIALLSYQALSGAINIESRVSQLTQQMNATQRVWHFFADDFQHTVARPWQDSFGNQQPVMVGLLGDRLSQGAGAAVGDDSYLLRFVRSGDHNFLRRPRSNMQLVGYRITANDTSNDSGESLSSEPTVSLWRDYWRPIDGADESDVKSLLLIDNIHAVRFRYLSSESQTAADEAWITGWPESDQKNNTLPIAIEISLDIVGIGSVTRLFPLVQATAL